MKTIIEKFEALSENSHNKILQKNLVVELARYSAADPGDPSPFNNEIIEAWKELWNSIKVLDESLLEVGRAQMHNATRSAARFFIDCSNLLKGIKPTCKASSPSSYALSFIPSHLTIVKEDYREDSSASEGIRSPA
ncbi:MAG: hypothetical protein Q7V63_05600 [Gammaproteobacteria bacterium]|nr:hypothetical protein [Gammaproteobacteria bacterium]